MKLEQLLEGLEYEYIDASGNVITDEALRKAAGETGITAITNDSRKVAQGGLFFCIVGANSDGHDFADKAAEAGAAALIVQRAPEFSQGVSAPVLIRVADSRYAMAMISAALIGRT